VASFDSDLRELNIGMHGASYDRYKLIALHRKELGVSPKRGAPVEEIVKAILAKRKEGPK
jgi:hypothetical protein